MGGDESPFFLYSFPLSNNRIKDAITSFEQDNNIFKPQCHINNGAKAMMPVKTIEKAKQYRDKVFLVAGGRIGDTFSFADWGNSALEFIKERVCRNEIVHSTTNDVVTIALAQESNPSKIVIGVFFNISGLANYLIE